jgi:hypothetical protein
MIWGWYKPDKMDWPSQNDIGMACIRYRGFGLGVVCTYWGYRILLGRWQICVHKK